MSRWLLALALMGCGPKTPTEPAADAGPDPIEASDGLADTSPDPDAQPGEGTPEAPPAAPVERPLHEQVNEAVELIATNPSEAEVQRAIGMLEKAVKRDPRNAEARFNLGVARHLSGDISGAMREYEACVGQDMGLGKAWLHMGLIQLDDGRADAAEQDFQTGIRNDPDEPGLRVALIDLMREQGRTDEAIAVAKEALKEHANSVEIYNSMGLTYQDRGELILARFVYQKALTGISGADQNAWLHLNLGWTFYLEDNQGMAVLELERALELDPYLVPALVNLSRIHMDNRNYEDTVPLLERASEKAPEDPGVQMNLGIAYRGVGRFNEAEKQYQRVLELRPNDPSPWMNLGILFGDYTKDYEKSLEAFQSYISNGGTAVETAEEYQKLVSREQRRVERQKKADEERKKREKDRVERQKLAAEQEAQEKAEAEAAAKAAAEAEAAEAAAASEGTSEEAPSPQEAPSEEAGAPEAPPAEDPVPAVEEGADQSPEAPETADAPAEDPVVPAEEVEAPAEDAATPTEASPWGEGDEPVEEPEQPAEEPATESSPWGEPQ